MTNLNQTATRCLTEFFGEHQTRFLANHWPNKYFVQHGPMSRFELINRIDDFKSNEQIITNLRAPVDVLWEDGRRESIGDKDRLLSLYRKKEAMFYIMDLSYYPAIDTMITLLSEELGVPKHFVNCEGFLANSDVKVDIHFDHETNFMLQICGKKIWSVAANDDFQNPLFPFFPNKPNRYYNNGKHPYTGNYMTAPNTDEMINFKVGPGTVTFLPRGYWHKTHTLGESFSIGFVINPPTMADMMLSYFQNHLHQNEKWRSHPLYIKDQHQEAITALNQLLSDIGDELEATEAEQVFEKYLASKKDHARLLHPIV